MRIVSLISVAALSVCLPSVVTADETAEKVRKAKGDLLGVWQPKSMKANGVDVPAEAYGKMRFTFRQDELVVRGNFGNDREDSCKYKIDVTKSPSHFEFTPPGQKALQGIYQIKDGELKICVKRGGSPGERPTEFKSAPDSGVVLFVMRKVKKPKSGT